MGKGETAPYEQFLLFPQRFQKACVGMVYAIFGSFFISFERHWMYFIYDQRMLGQSLKKAFNHIIKIFSDPSFFKFGPPNFVNDPQNLCPSHL